MVGLIALDLVLRIVLARMMDVAFVVDVPGAHPNDVAADPAGLGIPGYVIADFESLRHEFILFRSQIHAHVQVIHFAVVDPGRPRGYNLRRHRAHRAPAIPGMGSLQSNEVEPVTELVEVHLESVI
jgi:hypothetical protein